MNKAFKIIEANIYQPETLWMKFRSDIENATAVVTDNTSGLVTKYWKSILSVINETGCIHRHFVINTVLEILNKTPVT
jgi:hypothetical protein